MILDKSLQFASAVSVAHAAGTFNVGDVVDLTDVRDIGQGRPPIYLVILVDVAVITGGAAGTIAFQLVSDAQAAIATDGTETVHFLSKSFVTDDTGEDLTAGLVAVVVALPLEGVAYEEFLGVQAVVATTTTTAGKVSAFLTLDPTGWKANPSAVHA